MTDRSRPDVLDRVRTAAAEVSRRATAVRLVPERLPSYASELLGSGALAPRSASDDATGTDDPWSLAVPGADLPDEAVTEAAVALVLALDAVNFGSGWHPVVHKRPGCSGAVTMATHLRDWARREGPLTVERLAAVTPAAAHDIFGQPHDGGPLDDLMGRFAAALVDVATLVERRGNGSFTALVRSAHGSASSLVELLADVPSFRDVWSYEDLEVPLLKRAQLAVADLHRAFGGHGPGHFPDVDRLTAFADNLVPHVLRLDGVLTFEPGLVARIDAGRLLEPGSAEEVEIRAVGIHAVEELKAALATQGHDTPSWHLDAVLWSRGGGAAYKAVPRHRCRSSAY